jgi:glycerol-3-phosphate acyltransferase PlsX
MAAALLGLGRIKGIDRPAIAGVLPNEKGLTVLLDAGANVDCKPQHLLQFGVMGYLYAKKILGIANPRVGLLSNGEEETKGNETTLAAFPLLARAGINFTGNVEGRDIFRGTVDVVVCDGFVGNIVLKAGEGMAGALFKMMKEEITKSLLAKMGTVMAEPALKGFKRRLDYTEYGGAPLLGVNGVSIICHGSSTAKAVKNAIRVARESVDNRLVEAIRDSIESVKVEGDGCNLAQGID